MLVSGVTRRVAANSNRSRDDQVNISGLSEWLSDYKKKKKKNIQATSKALKLLIITKHTGYKIP